MDTVNSYDVFLSYHWRDHEPVEALARALRNCALTAFLDRWYLIPGQPWPQALEQVLRACRAVAVCVGPGEMGPWQQREVNLALERQATDPSFPVIPVLLPGADPVLGFLRQNTWVDLRNRPDDPGLLEILSRAIRREPPTAALQERVNATLATICPYRGLLYFREEDAPFFYGRETAVEQVIATVKRNSFIAVVGASGCGKSSVVRAGLISALRRERDEVWEVVTLVPGDRPLYSLAAALLPLLEPQMTETDRLVEINKQARYLVAGEIALRDIVKRALDKQPGTQHLLLVTDQWEELYTLTQDDSARRRFIDELLDTTATSPLSVVLTLRGDFVGRVLGYRPLSDRLQDAEVNLGPMTRAELERAIRSPAKKVGLQFEPGLVERILDDVGDEPGNLPLLEFVLSRLWEERRGACLLHEAYDAMGQLQGAVASKAEEVFTSLSVLEQQAVQRVFLQLVQLGESIEGDTRRRATLAEIGETSEQIVRKLADRRLLVTAQGNTTDEEIVEVSHEALILNWGRLKSWLNKDREFLLWRQRLRQSREEWEEKQHDEGALLRGARLVEAKEWLKDHITELSAEHAYIEASIALQERELKAAQQLVQESEARRRIQRQAIVGLIAGLVIALMLAGGLAHQWQRAGEERDNARTAQATAEKQRNLALSNKLVADVIERLRETGPEHGQFDLKLLLAAQAVRFAETPESRRALFRTLSIYPRLKRYLYFPITPYNKIRFCPQPNVIANGSQLWTAETQSLIKNLAPESCHISLFSPNCKTLAIGCDDGTLLIYDIDQEKHLTSRLEGHRAAVTELAFSGDGGRLASGAANGSVRLWDVGKRVPATETLLGHDSVIISLTFSRDGTLLASADAHGTIQLWDTAKGTKYGDKISTTIPSIRALDFSPDRTFLAIGGGSTSLGVQRETTVRLWDLKQNRFTNEPHIWDEHGSVANSLAFSPDGQLLAVATSYGSGFGGNIILWDVKHERFSDLEFTAHHAPFHAIAFDAEGQYLMSTFVPGILRDNKEKTGAVLWNTSSIPPPDRLLEKELPLARQCTSNVIFLSQASAFACGLSDGSILLVDPQSNKDEIDILPGRGERITRLARDKVGRLLIAGTQSGAIMVWDLQQRDPKVVSISAHRSAITHLGVSADGQLIASTSLEEAKPKFWSLKHNQIRSESFETPNLERGNIIASLALSPSSAFLVIGGISEVVIYDLDKKTTRKEYISQEDRQITDLGFSVDGRTIYVAGSLAGKVHRITVDRSAGFQDSLILGEETSLYDDPDNKVVALSLSSDGQTLAAGTASGNIGLWDVSASLFLGFLPRPFQSNTTHFSPAADDAIQSMAFGQADKTLMSLHRNSSAYLWNLDLLEVACRVIGRDMSKQEWEENVGPLQYLKTCSDN